MIFNIRSSVPGGVENLSAEAYSVLVLNVQPVLSGQFMGFGRLGV